MARVKAGGCRDCPHHPDWAERELEAIMEKLRSVEIELPEFELSRELFTSLARQSEELFASLEREEREP